MLNITDPDTDPEDIVFTLGTVAAHGDLKLNGVNLVTTNIFTLQDIIDGDVTYAPDSNYFGSDNFTFAVYDGLNSQTNKTFSITVTDVLEPLTGTSAGETLNGSSSGDLIKGLGGNDTIYGNDGNDTIYAHDVSLTGDTSGSDSLYGGNGNDTLYAGNGTDYLYGQSGSDVLYGTSGVDAFYDSWGVSGDVNRMEGGGGNDTYKYTIEAATGQANLLYIYDSGGTGDGLSFGPASGSSLNFAIGDLTFKRIGNDDIRIDGYKSGLGTFHVVVEDQLVDLSNASGGIGIEQLRLSAAWFNFKSYLSGYSGSMQTEGTSGNDTIHGILIGNLNDTVYAGAGHDTLHGDAGTDTIYGEDGNDIIEGGNGIDTLYGGTGEDTFVFKSSSIFTGDDVIKDFSVAQGDAIDISDVLDYDPMTDVITDFIQITQSGSNSFLSVDWDGGGNNFVEVIKIEGVTGLTDEAALVTSGNLIVV